MQFFRFIRFIENMLYPVRWARSWLGRLFKFGGKGPTLSLAGKVAACTFLIFLSLWIYYLVLHRGRSFLNSPGQMLRWTTTPNIYVDATLTFLIVILLTIFAYWCVRLASLKQESLYEEIDRCWDAVEQWKTERNFSWDEFQRYLVLGTDFDTAKYMHIDESDNAEEPLFPVGSEEWIHAFGKKREIFIHLNKTCNTSRRVDTLSSTKNSKAEMVDTARTLEADDPFGESLDVRNDEIEYGPTEEIEMSGGGAGGGGGSDPFGTIDADDDLMDEEDDSVDLPPSVAQTADSPVDEYEEDDYPDDRLDYFCKLARSRVENEIPFSSVIVAIPFDSFNTDNYQAITESVRKDLVLIRKAGKLNYSVIIAFTGMENDIGFPKLQSLLSRNDARNRFGAGCKSQNPPTLTANNFEVQVSKVCQTFEKWVFNRWSKNSQLSKAAQNKDLYKMLVRIRQGFKHRLEFLLNNSLIWKESDLPEGEDNELILAGCYFVSTGKNKISRGFLHGMFQKCKEFSPLAGWSNSALYVDRIYSTLSSVLFLGSVAVIAIFIYAQFGGLDFLLKD